MKYVLSVLLILFIQYVSGQTTVKLASPSGKITVDVSVSDSIRYTVAVNKKTLVASSAIALLTSGIDKPGINSSAPKVTRRSVRDVITNPVPFKRKNIPDHFNEMTMRFRSNFSLIFRAYDDGMAYRFVINFPDSIEIRQEVATFRFAGNSTVYFPEVIKRDNVDIYHTSFEEPYQLITLDKIKPVQLAFTPVLVDDHTVKAVITESDLVDYPGMFLRGTGGSSLRGDFAPYPMQEEIQGGEFKHPVVINRKSYIARTSGKRSLPWRVIIIADEDKQLLLSDLVYRLASPPSTQDWSWVQGGMSTEEWIFGNNLHSVNFTSGINTATYKYYVDFAKEFGLRYVMLDAGWSDTYDLFKITPGLDLEELAAYAKSKDIGLVLWTLSMTLERQLERALERFSELGIRVVMTDFMDRDDQKMLRFYNRIAEATAKKKLMLMLHGAFKNAGFERTYPHAITREAILGSEYNIWSEKATPEHDLRIPFIRMVSGPLDYEPGFMNNVNQKSFRPLPDHIMSMGTRTHQLAMFVVYESPLAMFAGNPADAWKEVEYTRLLGSIPTTWDDTYAIDAKLGEYVVLARRKGNNWFIGAMTNWTKRDIEIDLGFLDAGTYTSIVCQDGQNAERNGKDYALIPGEVTKDKKMTIHMAPGGGFVAKLIKQ